MKIISEDYNKDEILKILAWIEMCGTMSCNKNLNLSINGKECKVKFKFDTLNEQNYFNEIKYNLLKQYDSIGKETTNIILK